MTTMVRVSVSYTPFISSLNCGVKYASDRIRFDVNARLRILLTPESKRSVFYVGGLRLPGEVFWKRILAKLRIWRRFACQCERKVRRERPKVSPLPALVTGSAGIVKMSTSMHSSNNHAYMQRGHVESLYARK